MARNTWVYLENQDPRGLAQDGLTLATFTTAADIFPPVTLPAGYFASKKLLHIRCRGTYGTTSAPTYTFSLKVGSVVVVTSAAVTAGTTQTNMPWELDIQVQTRLDGTAGTLYAMGDGNWGLTSTTSASFYLPAAGTAPASSSALDFSTALACSIQVACSASSASNTVTGKIMEFKSIN